MRPSVLAARVSRAAAPLPRAGLNLFFREVVRRLVHPVLPARARSTSFSSAQAPLVEATTTLAGGSRTASNCASPTNEAGNPAACLAPNKHEKTMQFEPPLLS